MAISQTSVQLKQHLSQCIHMFPCCSIYFWFYKLINKHNTNYKTLDNSCIDDICRGYQWFCNLSSTWAIQLASIFTTIQNVKFPYHSSNNTWVPWLVSAPHPNTGKSKLHYTKESLHRSLTYGILEALSFTAAATPRAAKKLSPPHSHANASYYPPPNIQPINQPNQVKSNPSNPEACDAAQRNVLDQTRTTLPMCGARRSMQGSGKGVPLSHTSSSFVGSCDRENPPDRVD